MIVRYQTVGQPAGRSRLQIANLGRDSYMGEAWDWRQSYLEYSGAPEGQDQQRSAPQGPEAPAPGKEPHVASHVPAQDTAQPAASGLHAGRYAEYASGSPAVAAQGARAFTIAAFICGGLALLFLPFVLGPLGFIFGFVANSKGDRLGRWAGLMSVATTLLGIAFTFWVSGPIGVPLGD
jgi:hypothetical protein